MAETALDTLGAAVVTVLPQGDELPWEPAPGETPQSSNNWVSALFPLEFDAAQLRGALATMLSVSQRDALSVDFLADEDWSQSHRQYAVEECFGERLWLLPREAPERPGPASAWTPAWPSEPVPTQRPGSVWGPWHGTIVRRGGCSITAVVSGVLGLAALALGARQCWPWIMIRRRWSLPVTTVITMGIRLARRRTTVAR